MADDDFEDKFDETFYEGLDEGESQVGRSFRQGFGFTMGALFALSIALICVIILAYLAVEGGLITWKELLLL
ncbi:MAG TPA: hypothetical protein ENH13_02975 [Euryarchaeota archaeon]|nr:hypothetical protein [Euryarchaeota archaeon]